jgi:hypothetical protein
MNRRIAVVAGLAVIGVLATSDRPASRACPPQACDIPETLDPVYCYWDPIISTLCEEESGPTATCKCSDWTQPKSCTNSTLTFPAYGGYYYVAGGLRPGGLCNQIACGKCYVREVRFCYQQYLCLNPTGGLLCGGSFGDCDLRFTQNVYLIKDFKTEQDCCSDAF